LNGGEDSISFIKKTSIQKGSNEENAWEFIEKHGISVFYFPSFSFEWLRDMQKESKEL
jgi:acyl-coenzyme A synthetase/AMP-(fatty) acid ligase